MCDTIDDTSCDDTHLMTKFTLAKHSSIPGSFTDTHLKKIHHAHDGVCMHVCVRVCLSGIIISSSRGGSSVV